MDEPTFATCEKCGQRVMRMARGWAHHPVAPMSATERKALRHVPKVTVK